MKSVLTALMILGSVGSQAADLGPPAPFVNYEHLMARDVCSTSDHTCYGDLGVANYNLKQMSQADLNLNYRVVRNTQMDPTTKIDLVRLSHGQIMFNGEIAQRLFEALRKDADDKTQGYLELTKGDLKCSRSPDQGKIYFNCEVAFSVEPDL